jgi:hypothetical protein
MTQSSYLDAMQGASEERTEMYTGYFEGVPQLATPQRAKSFCGFAGLAGKQAKAVRGLR